MSFTLKANLLLFDHNNDSPYTAVNFWNPFSVYVPSSVTSHYLISISTSADERIAVDVRQPVGCRNFDDKSMCGQ